MKKLNRLKKTILALVMVLLCNPHGWAQSEKATNAGPTIQTAKKTATSSAEMRSSRAAAASGQDKDLQVSLQQAKAALEAGQANKSLNQEQVSALKSKIAAIEGRMKNGSAKETAVSSNRAAPVDPVRSIIAAKQLTRAQLLALNEQDQRKVMVRLSELTITDLVNAPVVLSSRQENVYYLTEDNFRNSDVMKQIYVLKNPAGYIIVKNGTVLPKAQMSQARFNSFPAERQKAIMESNQYEITN